MTEVMLEILYSSSFSRSLTLNSSSLLHLILCMLLLVISSTCLPNDIDRKSANTCLAHREDVDQQIKTWHEGLDVLGLSYINPIIEWLSWLWIAQAQVLADREQQAIDLYTTACQKELIASFRLSLPWFQGLSRSHLPFWPSVQISWQELSFCCAILSPFSQLCSPQSLYVPLFCLSSASGCHAHRCANKYLW